ncbi:ammonium transporter [Sulfuricurvum sp.]|uniref:ammonium transporter n=1 Tax=Sulfuricurvum sp. TaxID=2025608 RepID=UPI002610FC44|nr:ammonium transporter [Sulfuricurvum sp.]MDD2266307.1 ammonium transporter [Sulfuricurvum sp.]
MNEYSDIDLLWIVLSGILIFTMQLGFAMVETGTVRSKNTINVAMKNLIDTIFGVICFWIIGFGLMFGHDIGGIVGIDSFFIDGSNPAENGFFFFESMFAATSITIVSGAVAERMKFNGYVIVSIIVISIIYPIFGHWAWSAQGWLKQMGFIDFAGSTVVHSMGAWIGLAGAIILGPRLGRFRKGKISNFAPSNHNFIVFGVFILWFAWFAFNAGSLLAFNSSVSIILLNTLIAGSFGGFGTYLISLFLKKGIGVELFSFGIISGLVGITAGCADLTTTEAAFVGFVSAFIMYFSDHLLLKKFRIDDPLSVVGIHGFSGIWGTFAVGLFAPLQEGMSRMELIGVQSLGIVSAFIFSFGSGIILFLVLARFNSLRVSRRNEVIGLNVAEHQARLPWVETIDSIIRIMKTGNLQTKVYEERDTEVGIVARFFNYLLETVHHKQVELKNNNTLLRSSAQRDPLTALLNRRGLMENIETTSPYLQQISVIIIDIDKFKPINDTFGHAVGDSVLKELAILLKKIMRDNDIVARWGGEEFIVIIRTLDIALAEHIADKIRLSIETHLFPTIEHITCSFGVSAPKNDSVDFDTLFEQADKALYQAKELGRNRVCSW